MPTHSIQKEYTNFILRHLELLISVFIDCIANKKSECYHQYANQEIRKLCGFHTRISKDVGDEREYRCLMKDIDVWCQLKSDPGHWITADGCEDYEKFVNHDILINMHCRIVHTYINLIVNRYVYC